MGLSSSKKTTTKSESVTPLDAYKPYINQALQGSQDVFNANQPLMQSIGGKAMDVYNGLGSSNQALGSIYTGNNPAQQTYTKMQGAAANDPSLGILSHLAQGSTSPGQYDGIGENNPALAQLQAMSNGQVNGDTSQFYKDTLGGKYLNNNPYIDQIAQQGSDAALKAVNQRFAATGMGAGMSTPYAQAAGDSISNANNQLRYGAYNNELQRMGQIGGQSDSQYNSTQDRNLQAATGLGSLYNQTGALNLQAQQAKDAAFNSDRNNQLAAAGALGGQNTADNNTSLNAANGSIQSILQALGQVPGQTNAQLGALQSAAAIPYTGVNQYANLINSLTGKYYNDNSSTVEKSTPSVMDSVMKAASLASSFAGGFGALGSLGGAAGGFASGMPSILSSPLAGLNLTPNIGGLNSALGMA